MERRSPSCDPPLHLLLSSQIHDELLFEVREADARTAAAIIKQVRCRWGEGGRVTEGEGWGMRG